VGTRNVGFAAARAAAADTPESGRQPRAVPPVAAPEGHDRGDPELGEPLDLKAVAQLIGCSPWTVRQVLIPDGLPCFRATVNGKLIFYRQQVVRWVLRHQRTRGGRP
jgi:hypothetical protein